MEELTQEELKEYARFGNAVASLCVEKKGAIPAMPKLIQVQATLDEMAEDGTLAEIAAKYKDYNLDQMLCLGK